MKIDLFEGIFPGLVVFNDETNELLVTLDESNYIARVKKNDDGSLDWLSVLPWEMVEIDTSEHATPTADRVWDMLIGAELITDPELAKKTIRDYVYARISFTARMNKALVG